MKSNAFGMKPKYFLASLDAQWKNRLKRQFSITFLVKIENRLTYQFSTHVDDRKMFILKKENFFLKKREKVSMKNTVGKVFSRIICSIIARWEFKSALYHVVYTA